METHSASFLYHDSHFAGVDTLLHMNMKHILHLNSKYLADALIQSDSQRASSVGGCQCLAVVNFRLSWQLRGSCDILDVGFHIICSENVM